MYTMQQDCLSTQLHRHWYKVQGGTSASEDVRGNEESSSILSWVSYKYFGGESSDRNGYKTFLIIFSLGEAA